MEKESEEKTYLPVLLKGSCHCGKVKFTVESFTPVPFMICHCIADTKTSGRYNCNIMGESKTMKIEGADNIKTYQSVLGKDEHTGQEILSTHERKFCQHCASCLYAFDARWPEFVYPFLSCIDTPLKPCPEKDLVHIFCDFRKPYNPIPENLGTKFNEYPNKSIVQWHKEHNLYGLGEKYLEG